MSSKNINPLSLLNVFNVPCYSQYLDIKNPAWQYRGCGIIAVKSLLEYWQPAIQKKFHADAMLMKGIENGAYLPGIGWSHRGLVNLAQHYKFKGENFDWLYVSTEAAWNNTKKHLEKYPLIASVYKNFDKTLGGHLIVLAGISEGMIYYNEPAAQKRDAIEQSIPLAQFLSGWKKRIIVIYPINFEKTEKAGIL